MVRREGWTGFSGEGAPGALVQRDLKSGLLDLGGDGLDGHLGDARLGVLGALDHQLQVVFQLLVLLRQFLLLQGSGRDGNQLNNHMRGIRALIGALIT